MGDLPEVDQAILEKTKKELGAIIKAPKLTDKLLRKPPFRFLHDIITSVINTTGFASQLYTANEMDSKQVTEKEAKVFFLHKIISSVNYTLKLQPPLAAKPMKIVTGAEPENTNEFLQKLAAAAKVPKEKSDKAIKKVLAKIAEKAEAAQKAQEGGGGEGAPSAPPPKEEPAQQKEEPPKHEAPPEAKPPSEHPPPQQTPQPSQQQETPAARPSSAVPADAAAAAPTRPAPIQRSHEVTVEEREKKQPKEQTPAPAPQGVMVDKPPEKKSKNKLSKDTLDTDSEDEMAEPASFTPEARGGEEGAVADAEEGGYLARMAAAKKVEEEEKQKAAREAAERSGDKGESGGIRLQTTRGAKSGREREVFSTEVSKLKDSLQTLVKIINPLGRTFDYVQEDMDSMGKEYVNWRRQAVDIKVQTQEMERATEEALQPLYSQLQDLEDSITDQINKIHNVKANIIKNDETIATLLRMVVSST